MRWTDTQYAAYLKRQGHTPARQAPAQRRTAPKAVKHTLASEGYGNLSILINILGVALQERFPDVFTPIPCLGIHWGNEAKQLGVNACGWHRAGYERAGWVVMPCLPREIVEDMPRILARVDYALR